MDKPTILEQIGAYTIQYVPASLSAYSRTTQPECYRAFRYTSDGTTVGQRCSTLERARAYVATVEG